MSHKMRNLSINVLLLLSFFYISYSKEIAIFSGDGTWNDGIIAIESFLDYYNYSHKRIYENEFISLEKLKQYDAIIIPGGYAYNYTVGLKKIGIDNLRKYVSEGGSYIGICAGAYFASKTVEWEGGRYPYSLSLFDGTASGAIDKIAEWDNYDMTDISINQNSSINFQEHSKYRVLYYGGPIFYANQGFEYNTIATWDAADNLPAIINFNYKQGRVLLIGPHLEIEENSD